MIDVREADVLIERFTSTERFLLFTATDVPAGSTLPYWGVTIHVGSDAVGILVRLDQKTAQGGWTAYQLLLAVLDMTRRENKNRPGVITVEVERHVAAAASALAMRSGEPADEVIELDDSDGGLYALGTEPDSGDLWLCPDPEDPSAEGISAEQLLIVVDQMVGDATRLLPPSPLIGECRRHVRLALEAEVRRVTALRAASAAVSQS